MNPSPSSTQLHKPNLNWRGLIAGGLILAICVMAWVKWNGARKPDGIVVEVPIVERPSIRPLSTGSDPVGGKHPAGEVTSIERMELPGRSTSAEEDVTRLSLSIRTPDGTPVESAQYELVTQDSTRTATPIRNHHQLVSSTGLTTIIDLAPSVHEVNVVASADGYAPGRKRVLGLRRVDGAYRPSGLVEIAVSVELTQHEPSGCLEGNLSVDGIPGGPDNLDLQLFTATGERIQDVEFVLDRFASTYCIRPLPAQSVRLQVLGDGIAPMWLDVPDERPQGELRMDLTMSSGKSALLKVVDEASGQSVPGIALRVEVSIEAWRRSGKRGQTGHISITPTDERGVLTVRGLPTRGRLLVTSNDPPQIMSHGGLAFAPGEIYFEHSLSGEDPPVLEGTLRISTGPSAKCTLWGYRDQLPARGASKEVTLAVASDSDGSARVERHLLGSRQAWELQIEATGPARTWLEHDGRRISAELPIQASRLDRLGPMAFPPLSTAPVGLNWTGAEKGDHMKVLRLGGLVDEELASLVLDTQSGRTTLALTEGPTELGFVLQRAETSLRQMISWDPTQQDEVQIAWPQTDSVDVQLRAEGFDAVNASVALIPLAREGRTAILINLTEGLARQQSLTPGRYFFRMKGAFKDVLIGGVVEYVAGASELDLHWRGCPVQVHDHGITLDSIAGVDLSAVPHRLRTLALINDLGVEVQRPLLLRVPCDSEWSQLPQLAHGADQPK